jgi:ketosteroid isomerase-like protein
MPQDSAPSTALAFNDCITRRDIDSLAKLMTNDHVFIDTEGNSVSGKEACIRAWTSFFEAFPDYRNVFEAVTVSCDEVIALGHSVCGDDRLAGPAIWLAKVTGGSVSQWRVLEDTAANRALLRIAG